MKDLVVDMIEAEELKDALAVHEKVMARVKAVAIAVGTIRGEWEALVRDNPEKKINWELLRFHVDVHKGFKPELEVHATLRTPFYKRPKTEEYGDPKDDEDLGEYNRDTGYIERYISFPRRYLWTNDWHGEVEAKALENKRHWARIHAERLEELIREEKKMLVEMEVRLAKYRENTADA